VNSFFELCVFFRQASADSWPTEAVAVTTHVVSLQ